MQSNDGYLKSKIANVPYLLPYGQNIADHAVGVRISPLGEQLWDAISGGADRDILLRLLSEKFEAGEQELPELEKDLDAFLSMLCQNRLLSEKQPKANPGFPPYYVQLGPLKLALFLPEALCSRYFEAFKCAPCRREELAQQIRCFPYAPHFHENGTILTRSSELILFETPDSFILIPLGKSCIYELHIKKDGSLADLYCRFEQTPECLEEMFHSLRFAVLTAADRHGLYAVHSASLLYRGRAWLFSGPSGAGKSTQSSLWNRLFSTEILNGDLNLLGMEDKSPMCYGLPWCGTSGICTPSSYPLGGIVFLRQDDKNKITSPPEAEKRLHLLHRMISPSWTREQLAEHIAFCERIVPEITVLRLCCTKGDEAAFLTKDAIDKACADAKTH